MLHRILYAFVAMLALAQPSLAPAQSPSGPGRLDELFAALASSASDEWQVIEGEIRQIWSQSGSSSIDLLLERGRAALVAQEYEAAIEHLTALVDHAPEFAEGWNARATAYFRAGLYGPALADINRVLALEPRHFGALAGMALMAEQLGGSAQALQLLREVLRIHPHHPDATGAIKRLEHALGAFDT